MEGRGFRFPISAKLEPTGRKDSESFKAQRHDVGRGRTCQCKHEDFRCQPRLGKRVSPDSESESAQTRKAG